MGKIECSSLSCSNKIKFSQTDYTLCCITELLSSCYESRISLKIIIKNTWNALANQIVFWRFLNCWNDIVAMNSRPELKNIILFLFFSILYNLHIIFPILKSLDFGSFNIFGENSLCRQAI